MSCKEFTRMIARTSHKRKHTTSVADPLLTRRPSHKGIIRVLTYNIHHGRGVDGRYDLERIAKTIAAEAPDIIALQEIERYRVRSGRDDQPRLLAQMLGMHYCFYPVRDHKHSDLDERAGYGNAILTKFKIRSHTHFDLTVTASREPRGCLHALLETDLGPVHVFCVHLGLRYR